MTTALRNATAAAAAHHSHSPSFSLYRPQSSFVIAVILFVFFAQSTSALVLHPRTGGKSSCISGSSGSGSSSSVLRGTGDVDSAMSGSVKRILVTGANTGIGLALTKQLVAEHGCHVYLGSRSAERGAKAVEEVKKSAGDSVELLTIDVSDESSVKSAAASLSEKLGGPGGGDRLYAIVNNAGTGFSHGTSPAEILDTNARGPARVVDSFLPLLDPASGRIVNVGSGAGPMMFGMLSTKARKERYIGPMESDEIEREIGAIEGMDDDFAAYAGSKALLACYTMALARDHPDLTVSIVTPGYIRTAMTAGQGATKPPSEGTVSLRKCLFGDLGGSGWFWGSDGLRSPLHYLRNPGEPEYDGAVPKF